MEALMKSRNTTRVADLVNLLKFKKDYAGADRSDWMKLLPPAIAKLPLTEIAIPGSHDSFTVSLNAEGPIGPTHFLPKQYRKIVNKIHKWLFGNWFFDSAPISKKIIHNWGVTQSLTLADQLKAGIRYFDFRVATKSGADGLVLLHSLYAQTAKEAFNEINGFLNNHPKEVVIIDVKKFYEVNADDHTKFISDVRGIFGKKLVTEKRFDLSLENCWKAEQQVIFLDHRSDGREDGIWAGRQSIDSRWPNTNDKSVALSKLNKWRKQRQNAANYWPRGLPFWVTQGVLTATAKEILPSFSQFWKGLWSGDWSSMKAELGSPMCRAISNWVKDKKIGKGEINIVITDFVEESDFIKNVLALNTN